MYVPLKASQMVEPPLGHRGIYMLDVLPSDVSTIYRDASQLLTSDVDRIRQASELNGKFDKVLGERSEYLAYLSREDVRDL